VATERLSQERIARVALELSDREGFGRVSMRRLAAELGVGTMTLYGYFRDKDELIDAVVDLATSDHGVLTGEGTWRERLAELMRGLKKTLEAHPSAVRLRLDRPLLSPGALRVTEAGLAILAEAGFRRAEAARGYRSLFLYTFGWAGFATTTSPEEARRSTKVALAALPTEEYPVLSSTVEEAADAMADAEGQFEYGLDVLLDGLQGRLGRAGGSPRAGAQPLRRDRSRARRAGGS
jgi:AcrR family transcriptional regulator